MNMNKQKEQIRACGKYATLCTCDLDFAMKIVRTFTWKRPQRHREKKLWCCQNGQQPGIWAVPGPHDDCASEAWQWASADQLSMVIRRTPIPFCLGAILFGEFVFEQMVEPSTMTNNWLWHQFGWQTIFHLCESSFHSRDTNLHSAN